MKTFTVKFYSSGDMQLQRIVITTAHQGGDIETYVTLGAYDLLPAQIKSQVAYAEVVRRFDLG